MSPLVERCDGVTECCVVRLSQMQTSPGRHPTASTCGGRAAGANSCSTKSIDSFQLNLVQPCCCWPCFTPLRSPATPPTRSPPAVAADPVGGPGGSSRAPCALCPSSSSTRWSKHSACTKMYSCPSATSVWINACLKLAGADAVAAAYNSLFDASDAPSSPSNA